VIFQARVLEWDAIAFSADKGLKWGCNKPEKSGNKRYRPCPKGEEENSQECGEG